MTSGLDMSLEDLIKNNKGNKPTRSNRHSLPGPTRRFPNRSSNRPAPYAISKAPEADTWQHDMFSDQQGMGFQGRGPSAAIETGTKLYISNLDYGVSNEDIKELFSEVGDLKRYSIHYDRSGRSKGTADVVYTRRADALAAVKRYNNVQLDGKPMKIEIVGTNITTPAAPLPSHGTFGNANGVFRGGRGRGGPMGRPLGGRGGGRGFGGGRGGRRKVDSNEKISAEDLDAELEKYHSQAMETN